jgi:hypothetical protein
MRPKFLFVLLLSALLVLGAAFFLKQYLGNVTAPLQNFSNVESIVPPQPAKTISISVVKNDSLIVSTMTPEQHEASIDAEADHLRELSMNDDAASLSDILADLTNSEKEIRSAAIEAARQFGSPNAIPALKTAAANTTDPGEQAALLAAADYLSLPSFGDPNVITATPLDQIQANNQKREQQIVRRQKTVSNQNPTSTPQSSSGN